MATQIEITLKRSLIGRPETQRRTVAALGLRKLHQSVVLTDSPGLQGQLDKVAHLVQTRVIEG